MYDYIPIPGEVETTASPVTPQTTMGITEKHVKVSKNSEEEEDNYSPVTPSLMVEISETMDSMSRTETAVFSVDGSDSDNTVKYNATETIKPNEDMTENEPPIEIDLTEGESIVLNEEVRLNTPIANESNKNSESDSLEITTDTQKSRGRSRRQSSRAKSSAKSAP